VRALAVRAAPQWRQRLARRGAVVHRRLPPNIARQAEPDSFSGILALAVITAAASG
jgi:hypothetical protein